LETVGKFENLESQCLRKDGSRIWISESTRAVRDAHGALVRLEGFVQDITDRKRAQSELEQSQKQLRELAVHLQSAREVERTAIAREIHDEIGQLLTGLKFDLVWLKTNVAPDPAKSKSVQSARKIAKVIRQVEATIASMRRIASAQRPPALQELGLDAALEWQAREFTQQTDIPCLLEMNTRHALALTDEQSTALFRIFQEALANVAHHANATQVQASLKEEDATLVLEIRDNGKGIAKQQLTDVRSFGIIGMRERALMLGGELIVSAKRGAGTTVRVIVPLASLPPSRRKGELP
jgi:signal transduction histidine kinase